MLNQAKDTAQLVTDAGGKLLNLATFGTTFRVQAQRTDGRINGALALGRALVNDPVGTGIRLGEGYVQPFATAGRQLANGQLFEGTATATEAGADIIVRAATGGAGFVVNLLNRGPNGRGPGGNGNGGNDQADTPETANGQTGFSGRRDFELQQPEFQPSRNQPATIGGREFSGHALDQMQNRGLTPTVVENAINPANLGNYIQQ